MKFMTVKYAEKEIPAVLSLDESGVYFLKNILGQEGLDSILAFIQGCEKNEREYLDKIQNFIADPNNNPVSLKDCEIKAPIPRPLRNVICLGMNYRDHVQELKGADGKPRSVPKVPVYFGKMATEIIGTGGMIELHEETTDSVDYEVELVIVIGKGGRNIAKEKAHEHIFGYTIMNDITARDLQSKHQQFIRGKSLDTFTAMGPAIVYKEALVEPLELDLSCEVNGEIRQSSNTRNFIFDIPYMISDFSKGTTLQAGDLIATGTPGGVGKGFTPPKYLKAGDKVVCIVEKIGTLKNKVKE